MVDAHRLPPFENVTICITGNEVADLRNRIHKQIRLYGGNSVKSLDRTCTHLLCSSDQTDKVSYANRINAEREIARSRPDGNDIPPPIHILWEEWFWDCLYVKGHLEYDRYHITNPRPKPVSESVMVSPPISRLSLPDDAGPSTLPQAVPLSSLLSGPPDSIAPAKRIKHAATREWEAIMKPRGYVNQKQQSSQGMDLDRHESTTSSSPMKKSWVSGSFDGLTAPPGFSRRSPVKKAAMKNVTEPSLGSKAVSAVRLLPEDDAPSSRPTGNAAPDTFLGKFSKATAFSSEESSVKTAQIAKDNSKSVFSGLTFRVLGDAVCDNVFTAITQSSGTIRQIGSPDFYIVRLVG
ncbi:hypothetical protein FRC17_008747 [Serendipita sp. 399]|nr:hypothetical protein FRC17_008747 [Serendipita sp. 399]